MTTSLSGESTASTRRTFLSRSAVSGIGLCLLGSHAGAMVAASPRREICVFSKHLQWLDYGPMAELAAEIGFDGVDLSVRPGGHVLPERVKEDLPRAVTAVRKAGLTAPMITTAITDAKDPLTDTTLSVAHDQGVRCYRMGYLSYDGRLGVAGTLERLKPQMAALAALNERYQIHGAYQNHAGTRIGGPVWDIWELIRDLDPRWIGCQYDIRHATVEGGTSWSVGMKLLAPYIRCLVIKDIKWGQVDGRWRVIDCPVGEGMVDFKAYVRLLKALEIGGPISMHFEYPPFEGGEGDMDQAERQKITRAAFRKDLDALRSFL